MSMFRSNGQPDFGLLSMVGWFDRFRDGFGTIPIMCKRRVQHKHLDCFNAVDKFDLWRKKNFLEDFSATKTFSSTSKINSRLFLVCVVYLIRKPQLFFPLWKNKAILLYSSCAVRRMVVFLSLWLLKLPVMSQPPYSILLEVWDISLTCCSTWDITLYWVFCLISICSQFHQCSDHWLFVLVSLAVSLSWVCMYINQPLL